jgi:hypothetical protein
MVLSTYLTMEAGTLLQKIMCLKYFSCIADIFSLFVCCAKILSVTCIK